MIRKNDKTIASIYDGTTVIGKIYKGTLKVYESFKNLLASGVPPLTLLNCKGVDLVDYKMYGNSIQEGIPTPEAPIEVESVGDKTKNLLDINSMLNDKLVDNGDGSYTLTKISTEGRFSKAQDVSIPANTTLTLSLDVIDCNTSNKYNTIINARLKCTDETDIYMSINKNKNFITKTIEKNVKWISIYISPEDLVGEYATFKNLQLEIGTTPTEYEPYGYRIPVKASQSVLPKEYQQVEYIESTGTQFINTKIVPRKNATYDINVDFSISELTNYGNIISSQASGNAVYLTRLQGNKNVLTWWACSSSYETIISSVVLNKKYNMAIHYESGNNYLSIDGENPFTNSNDLVETGTPFVLFTNNTSNSYPSKSKIYKCKIKSSDNEELNLIPCYRKSDNEIGLYDITNNKFYTNSGTGTFLKGNNIDTAITNIYLNEPLRKIGDYTDYIDFENNKVVRQLKHLRLTSALNWIAASSGGYPYKYCTVSDIAKGVPDKMFMCNTYVITQRNVSKDDDRICYRLNYNGFFVTDSTYISVNSFNEMLDANNVYVIYPTNQKEETIELPNIPTIKGTTILEVDTTTQPSNLEVEYKGKK